MPLPFLFPFSPDADWLLRAIASHIDDGMLGEIAEADYGRLADRNLMDLTRLRDRLVLPVLDWGPREVLELIRWSEPADPTWKPGSTGTRGHWMRAFACTALLRSYDLPQNEGAWLGLNETLIQLVMSLDALGGDLDGYAASFLAWFINRFADVGDGDEMAFFGIALLWFALRLPMPPSEPAIVELCEWTAEQERQAARMFTDFGSIPGRWLLSTNAHDLKNPAWEELGGRLADLELQHWAGPVQDWVRLLGRSLAGRD